MKTSRGRTVDSRFMPRGVMAAFALLVAGLVMIPLTSGTPAAAAPPTTSVLRLRVESGRQWIPSGLAQGQAIPKYRWVVVQDDTGDPTRYGANLGATDTKNSNYACTPQSRGGDPAYPANCQWPAIHSIKAGTTAVGGPNGAQDSEIVAQGDETVFAPDLTGNPTKGIDTSGWVQNDHNPNRSYMISVTADGYDVPGCTASSTVTCHVDGFKIDGQWFSLPLSDNSATVGHSENVTVDMQPYPLPLTTVRMKVWNDTQTNGAYDTGEANLPGFEGHLDDVLGPVTTDWYGNPLCTMYQHDGSGLMLFGSDGKPLVQTVGGHCFSDANGVITIPYLGPDRYASTVTAPNGQVWFQTSTLEGWHDWDTWSIEGWNGYDPEFVQGAEPFPFAEFGFVQVQTASGVTVNSTTCCNYTTPSLATGSIKGTVVGIGEYTPQVGGLNFGGNGKHIIENINQPLISLIDTARNDDTVYVGRGNTDGTFSITNVPDGDYVLTFWDEDQAYLLTQANVSVVNGQAIDMGVLDVAAWHSQVKGKVCNDTNRNGKCDPGEAGIPGLKLNLLGRDNSVQFYGDNTATTDANGNYSFPRTYPLGQWVVAQGYWEQFYTVGVTYQTENQPTETTVMANGGFVDVSTFNLIGHQTRMDWAVHPYESPANASLGPVNGGIVGEMVYDTTRNELDARFSANESYQPGVSGIPVHLYAPVKCDPTVAAPTGATCTPTTTAFGSNNYLTINDPANPQNGAYVKLSDSSGNPIDLFAPYVSETWKRPTDCTARGADGSRVAEQVLPALGGDPLPGGGTDPGGHDCLEAPMMSSQVGNNSVGPFMQVTGNYGFTQIDHDPTTGAALAAPITIPPADYIVQPQSPVDPTTGKPTLEVTKEEEVNILSGDKFVAPGETPVNPPSPNRTPPVSVTPAIPPFPCVGALHTVNVVSSTADAHFDPANPATTSGIYNPDFVAGGGSPYQGLRKPLCDARLVTVRNGRSATPNFMWHTQGTQGQTPVPMPGRIFGIAVDDVNLSTNPKELFYGEKYGIPNMPIGIYDFSNRLVRTIQTDPQGAYEVILPSTSSYNCPLPAGPCPGIYRFLANDPGQPAHPNPGYNPAYRTIGGFFEVWPGVSLPSDLAPTPVAFAVENPGAQQAHPAQCLANDPAQPTAPKVPEFFSIDKPYVTDAESGATRNRTIKGQYFGTTPGTILVDGVARPGWIQPGWTDTQIVIRPPASFPSGPHQVIVQGANGQRSVNGITLHLFDSGGSGYHPTVLEVGAGKAYDPAAASHNTGGYEHALQDALDAAATSSSNKLVVVYPGPTDTFNPFGSYFENVIIHSPVKVQGVGPGGIYTDPGSGALLNTDEKGTVLDGLGFGTDGARDAGWQTTLASVGTIIGPNGLPLNPATVAPPEGEVVLSVATSANQYTSSYKAAIDGMTIQNGDVMDFVPNVNTLGNGSQVGGGNNTPTNPNQGGAVVALASTKYLQLTNNIVRSNAGAYGAIRIGTPLVGDNNNDGIHVANNRILNNGGTNLAGAVGIFTGARSYEVNNNDLCGNFSNEYGGAISHFGLSGGGAIHDNRVYFNGSYDEGGGVIIAGEPPTGPNAATTFGAGAGAVNIYNNLVEANLANDDGGGLRFLTAGNFPYNVYNNMIVNNISTHEGGGVAIDNAPNVRFYNNTVMKNVTTATAATSNGQPAPAGLSTAMNNTFLQATLPAGSPLFSNPLQFNNIFWDNRAGTWDPAGGVVRGIGGKDVLGNPDATPLNHWDMGVPGTTFRLAPTNSVLQSETINHNDVVASPTNKVDQDPLVNAPFDVSVLAQPWRGNPNFVASVIVAQDIPVSIMGDYHLSATTSSAFNAGAASKAAPTYQQPPASIAAPAIDIDNQGRPALGGFDSGADEFPGAQADLSITKDDGVASIHPGDVVHYTITVGDAGPGAVALAPVTDNVPAALTGATWTCTAPGGSACGAASGTGNINTTVTLPAGGSATFTLNATVAANASGSLANTATVATPAGTSDPIMGNNSATDTDTIIVPLPTLGVLDNFNRANANTLGTNWSQLTLFGAAAIRIVDTTPASTSTGVANATLPGNAYWNVPAAGFGAKQGAAFTIANSTFIGDSLILKASGTAALGVAPNFIRVRVTASGVVVETTTNFGLASTTQGTFAGAFANGSTLTAVANADGSVDVWRTAGTTTTYLGHSNAVAAFAGTGRIGMQLPSGARVDNFSGGTVP